MFFSFFGGAGIGVWCLAEFGAGSMMFILDIIVMLLLLALSLRQFRKNKQAYDALAASENQKRVGKLFNLINALQWAVIFGVSVILSRIGEGKWIIPAIIFIVGLHFLPLAKLFGVKRHLIVGVGLIVWSIAYSTLMPYGPQSACGPLGAGLILWLSAIAAIWPVREPDSQTENRQ